MEVCGCYARVRTACESAAGCAILDRLIGDEAARDQTMRQQIGQSAGIVHVGLAAGHVFNMRGIGQDQFEPAIA